MAPEPHPDNAAAAAGGYAYMPFCSLECVVENSKEAYYLALRQAQAPSAAEVPLAEKIDREMSAVALSDLAVRTLDYVKPHGRVTT